MNVSQHKDNESVNKRQLFILSRFHNSTNTIGFRSQKYNKSGKIHTGYNVNIKKTTIMLFYLRNCIIFAPF
jgi:hypothetical protein